MSTLTPLHWFSRIILGIVLLVALFLALRLGVTIAGIYALVVFSFWLWVKSGGGARW